MSRLDSVELSAASPGFPLGLSEMASPMPLAPMGAGWTAPQQHQLPPPLTEMDEAGVQTKPMGCTFQSKTAYLRLQIDRPN